MVGINKMINGVIRVTLTCAILSIRCLGDTEKVGPGNESPVQRAVKALPAIAAARMEPSGDNRALEEHLSRVKNAPDARQEAAELESLVAWIGRNNVAKVFEISLGIRCPKLTDEELRALSSWPQCTLTLTGYVRRPVIVNAEITFKESKNLLRLVPLAVSTKGGIPR